MKSIKKILGVSVLALMAFGLFTVANDNAMNNSTVNIGDISYMDFGDTRPPEFVDE